MIKSNRTAWTLSSQNDQLVISERKLEISTLLDLLCQAIELPEARRQEVEERYQAMGDWLDANDSPLRAYRPRIHSQGSVRIGTTVRPPTGADYDLDSVCRFSFSPFKDPALLKKLLLDRLRAHGTYREMIKEKARCVRVGYADFFHHDIMPCVPDQKAGGTCVLVPDKNLLTWKESDPEGYARRFDEAAAKMPRSSAVNAFNASLQNKANVDPLPDHDGLTKEPLRRCVQLIKRHRDEYFIANPEVAPISVILTTLAMHAYESAVAADFYDTPLDLIIAIIAGMPAHVSRQPLSEGRLFYSVPNPTNIRENFAEKWNTSPRLPEAFYEWHRAALATLRRLATVGGEGIDQAAHLLGESLGQEASKKALRAFSTNVQRAVTERRAAVLPSGIVTLRKTLDPGTISIKQHTNFGAP